jgi:putative membrane protein
VPFFNWIEPFFGWHRNHFDRLGHFMQGFVPALIARELFIQLCVVTSGGWRFAIVILICMGISALYELLEWAIALASGAAAVAFLGTQGDAWDTQEDMFMALIGAICALILMSRWQNRQMRHLPSRW